MLDGARFCYNPVVDDLCRIKKVRSDFVGSVRELMRGRFVATLAVECAISFPGIPQWLRTWMDEGYELRNLKMVVRADRESETIRKMCDRE